MNLELGTRVRTRVLLCKFTDQFSLGEWRAAVGLR